jgi:citrate lyase subunit beta/citryl-CoA lyase
MLTSLSIALLAARAQGLAILDGVFLDLDDEAGFVGACEQGRELGFDGKTLIHPNQIAPCNRVFAPSLDDVAQAKKIVRAFEAVRQAGKGVVLVDGKLIENLHVDEAKRIVELAAAIERMTGSAA